MTAVDAALAEFKPEDYSVRLVHALFKAIPMAPPMHPYRNLDEAIQQLYPAATPAVVQKTRQLADSEGVRSALWMANLVDTADSSIAAYSGVKSAFSFLFGDRKNSLETDPQQGVDAGLKLLGVAYIVYKLFPGSLGDKLSLYHTAPAGKALEMYFAAVEVALPFADNAMTSGGGMVSHLWEKYGGNAADKLVGVAGAGQVQEAKGMLGTIMAPVETVVQTVVPYARGAADSIKPYVPSALSMMDSAAGVVATAADAMPIYKYLGARLAAESCVLLASRG